MPALILATGTGVTPSAPFTLAAGESAALCLRGVAVSSDYVAEICLLEAQDEAGAWWVVSTLNRGPAQVLSSAGTYRVRRAAGVSLGVFRA